MTPASVSALPDERVEMIARVIENNPPWTAREKARAILALLPAPSAWQGMETAPRENFTHILAYWPPAVADGASAIGITLWADGDWILPEPKADRYYPCKPDIFAATYEPIP